MKKSRRRETLREEAERQDALEAQGALDDLPFTRLRRYAKETSQVYAIRIPVSRLEAIRRLAERRDEQPTALLREWVLERLDQELAYTGAGETAPPYRAGRQPRATKAKKSGRGAERAAKR